MNILDPQSDHLRLEHEVMTKLLHGDNEILRVLRNQYENARVASRKFTGVGFYTVFQVADDLPKVPGGDSFDIGDIVAITNGNEEESLGFVLCIDDGTINFLEGYT